jgi:hypothetical protein
MLNSHVLFRIGLLFGLHGFVDFRVYVVEKRFARVGNTFLFIFISSTGSLKSWKSSTEFEKISFMCHLLVVLYDTC